MPRQRNGIWYADCRLENGQRFKKSLGPKGKRQDAVDLETKARRDIIDGNVGRAPDRLISEAFMEWLDGDGARLKGMDSILGKVKTFTPFIANQKLNDIVQCAVRAKKAWIAEGLATATINSRLRLIRRVANLAFEWRWLKEPHGKRIKMLGGEKHRQLFLTVAEFDAFTDACPDRDVAKALVIYAYTGLRKMELFKLSPRQIIGDEIHLGITTKSGRRRTIPVPPHVVPLLQDIPLNVTESSLRRNFELARHAIGMGPGPAPSMKGRGGKRPKREKHSGLCLRLHDLRHTYASWLIQNGAQLTHVRDLLGHATIAITADLYAHLLVTHLREAVAMLPTPAAARLRVVK